MFVQRRVIKGIVVNGLVKLILGLMFDICHKR